MPPRPQPKYPAGPLLAKFPERIEVRHNTTTVVSPHRQIAYLAGLNPSYALRLANDGFTEQMADRVAVACGYHPAEIWGQLWWDRSCEPDPEPAGRFCGRHIQHAERERP